MLTEKPMAVSSAEGQAMVEACAAAGVKLMVAYRIQYEPYNRRVMQWVRGKTYGRLLAYHGVNTQTVAEDAGGKGMQEAIYESARSGQPVKLAPQEGLDRFRGPAES